jgi:hypothetical protein
MGHHYEVRGGIGKNQEEAKQDALASFYHENGHRCDVREVLDPKLIRRVPPSGWVTVGNDQHWKPDPCVPIDKWLEQWSFNLHYHA